MKKTIEEKTSNNKHNWMYIIFICMFCCINVLLCACNTPAPPNVTPPANILPSKSYTVGTWWWNDDLGQEYMDFAKENSVNEIYFCSAKFDNSTDWFIHKANDNQMKVYWLCGEYQWIDDFNSFDKQMQKYLNYQNSHFYKFAGVHLDVEPHQNKTEWKKDRPGYIVKYLSFIKHVIETYPTVNFDFDIPAWLEDVVTFDGQTKAAFKFVFDYAERVFVMSYRDSAKKIYSCAQSELEYAEATGKTIFLSVDTGPEENIVTFQEEGKIYMIEQLAELETLVPQEYGLAIHQIYRWKNLKD